MAFANFCTDVREKTIVFMHFFSNVATVFVFYTTQHLRANLNVYVYYKEIKYIV